MISNTGLSLFSLSNNWWKPSNLYDWNHGNRECKKCTGDHSMFGCFWISLFYGLRSSKNFRHLCFEWRKVSFLLVFLPRFQPLWRLCWLSVRWNLPDFLCKSVPSHSTREKWQEPAYLAPNVSPLAGAVHLGVPYMTSGSKLFQLVEDCEILILTMDPWILCESQFVLVESCWIFLILFALFTLERWEVSH